MDLIRAFAEYAVDFERTYVDDDWRRLERHFHGDATYRIENSPFDCVLHGRASLLAGMRRSLNGFDRRCALRSMRPTAPPEIDGNKVIVRWSGRYAAGTVEALEVSGTETAEYRGQRIASLVDSYQARDVPRFIDWLRRCGLSLDPSYR